MSAARQDILMALHLDPHNAECISILSRLYPGKSIKDVLQSRPSMAARDALDNLVTMAHPIRLAPIAQ